MQTPYDHRVLTVATPPYRQWCAPITLAGNSPIFHACQPLAKPPLLNVRGVPVYFLVRRLKFLLERGHFYEPRQFGVIQEWRRATPAKWVIVDVFVWLAKQTTMPLLAAFYQIINNPLFNLLIFYKLASPLRNFFGEITCLIHGMIFR